MKKILITGIAAAALSGAPAIAADMPVKAPTYKAAAPYDPWTGCYLGVEGGGAWGRTKQTDADPASPFFGLTLQNTRVDGGLVGGTAGCNYQTGNFVWGVEGDWSWANLKGQANSLPPFTAAFVEGAKVDWLATVRGRLGYAIDRTLFYVTGGVAFANVKATEPFDPGIAVPGPLPDVSGQRTRGIIGGGIEWRFADPHWSFKVEYLYVDFGTKFYHFTSDLDRNVSLRENIVRVGLNYKFDWGKSPVVAKY